MNEKTRDEVFAIAHQMKLGFLAIADGKYKEGADLLEESAKATAELLLRLEAEKDD